MPLFVLSVIIQVACLVHIVKTGRSFMWFWLVLILPGIGMLAYIIVEIMPEWMDSRAGYKTQEAIVKGIAPNKALKDALLNYSISETVEHTTALADAYKDKEMFEEARALYRKSLKGFDAHDPDILIELIPVEIALENEPEAAALLRTLMAHNPDYKNPRVPLLDAMLEEAVGDGQKAAEKYAVVIKTFPGPEAKFRYAMLLKSQGDIDTCRSLLDGIVQDSKISGRHYNSLFKDWVKKAKSALREV